MKLVAIKIPAKTKKTIAIVPEIIFPKYKRMITAAIEMRIALSMLPMFASMILLLKIVQQRSE